MISSACGGMNRQFAPGRYLASTKVKFWALGKEKGSLAFFLLTTPVVACVPLSPPPSLSYNPSLYVSRYVVLRVRYHKEINTTVVETKLD